MSSDILRNSYIEVMDKIKELWLVDTTKFSPEEREVVKVKLIALADTLYSIQERHFQLCGKFIVIA